MSDKTSVLKNILDKPQIIFTCLALFFGLLFLFITPVFEVPDEPAHILRTAEVAQGIFYNKEPAQETKYDKYFQELNTFKYKEKVYFDNPNYYFHREPGEFHYASRNSAIMYIAPALGIKIGTLFTQDGKALFYIGRIFSLLLYIILTAAAIKITPVFKYPFMFTALLPMALFEGMSYSADSFNNGFAFLFFAFVFKLIFDKKEMTKKDLTILSVFSIIGAFCKGLIYPLGLFLFLPPPGSNWRFKNKYLYITPLIFITLLLCYIWITINPKNLNYEYSVINDAFYIIKAPFVVFFRIIITTLINGWHYIREFIGMLGWLHISLKPDIYIQTTLAFLSMFIFFKEKITLNQRIIALLSFTAFYFIIQYMHLIYWSDSKAIIISGFQGRYLISLIPLIFVVFTNSKFNFNEKFIKIYKIFLILFIIYILICSYFALNEFYNILHIDRYMFNSYLKYGIWID